MEFFNEHESHESHEPLARRSQFNKNGEWSELRRTSTFVSFVLFVVEKERGGLSGMKNIREIGYAELTQHASTGLFNLLNLIEDEFLIVNRTYVYVSPDR